MAITADGLPPFLKRSATADESTRRDFESSLLRVVASKSDGILGLRLIAGSAGDDVVHLLITPDCRRKVLGQALEVPELRTAKRSKASDEPGHFIPILAATLERTAWWHEQMGPQIRADYLKRRRAGADGDSTRNASAAELAAVAGTKRGASALAPPPAVVPAHTSDWTIGGTTIGTRDLRDAMMLWLRERDFDLITPQMVVIGKTGRVTERLVEITLSAGYASTTLVRRLKTELHQAGVAAEAVNVNNATVIRFPLSVVDDFED